MPSTRLLRVSCRLTHQETPQALCPCRRGRLYRPRAAVTPRQKLETAQARPGSRSGFLLAMATTHFRPALCKAHRLALDGFCQLTLWAFDPPHVHTLWCRCMPHAFSSPSWHHIAGYVNHWRLQASLVKCLMLCLRIYSPQVKEGMSNMVMLLFTELRSRRNGS